MHIEFGEEPQLWAEAEAMRDLMEQQQAVNALQAEVLSQQRERIDELQASLLRQQRKQPHAPLPGQQPLPLSPQATAQLQAMLALRPWALLAPLDAPARPLALAQPQAPAQPLDLAQEQSPAQPQPQAPPQPLDLPQPQALALPLIRQTSVAEPLGLRLPSDTSTDRRLSTAKATVYSWVEKQVLADSDTRDAGKGDVEEENDPKGRTNPRSPVRSSLWV